MQTGTNVSINIRDLGVNWELGKSYRVDIDQGLTKEVGNNRTDSEARPNFQTISTLTRGVVASTFPVSGSSGFKNQESPNITFDRIVYKNSGTINLYQGTTLENATLIKSIDVNDSSVLADTSSTVYLDLLGDINRMTDYFITFNGEAFNDNFYIDVNTVTNHETWNFETGAGPQIVDSIPEKDTVNSYETAISVSYDEPISFNPSVKNYYVYREDDSSLIATLPSNDPRITKPSDVDVDFNLLQIVDSDRTYYITADVGVAQSEFLFDSEPIVDGSRFRYTTGFGSTVTNVSPERLTTGSFSTTAILIYNTSTLVANSGNYYVVEQGETDQVIGTVSITDPRITIQNLTTQTRVTLDLRNIVDGDSTYYLKADYGILKDQRYFSSKEIDDDSVFKYSTGPGPRFFDFTPPNLTVGSSATSLRFIFDKSGVTKNTGNLYVKDSGGTTVGEIPVAGDRITLQSLVSPPQTWVNIDVKGIVDTNETYYITSDFGTFKDTIPFSYDGSINSSTWKYSIGDVGPKLTSTTPATSSTNIGVSIISWNYDRNTFPPKTSDRKFYVYKDGALHSSYTLGESILSYSTTTNSVQLNLTAVTPANRAFWSGGSTYHILADKGAVRDVNFWSADAISSSTQFRFTTAPKPVVTATSVIYSGTTILSEIEFDRNVDVDYFVVNTTNYLRLNKIGASLSRRDFAYPGVPFYGVDNTGISKVGGKKFRVDLGSRPALFSSMTKGSTLFWSSDIFASGDPDRMSQQAFSQSAATTFTLTGAIVTSTNVAYDSYISTGTLRLNYDRTIASLSTGSYYIYEGESEPGSVTTSISTSSGRITTSTSVVSINLFGLLEGNKTYWLRNDDGTFVDLVSFTNEPILDGTKVRFKTSNTTFSSVIPLIGEIIKSKDITVSYNKNQLTKGTGLLSLVKKGTVDSVISSTNSISITSSTTSTVSFTFGKVYEKNSEYYITATENVVYDVLGIPSLSIPDDSVLSFTTDNGPVFSTVTNLTSFLTNWAYYDYVLHPFYTFEDTGGINPLSPNIVFDRPLEEGTGNISFYNTSSQLMQSYNNNFYSISTITSNVVLTSFEPSWMESLGSYYINWQKEIVNDSVGLSASTDNTSTTLVKFDTGLVYRTRYNAIGNGTAEFGATVACSDDYFYYSSGNSGQLISVSEADKNVRYAVSAGVEMMNGAQNANYIVTMDVNGTVSQRPGSLGAFSSRPRDYNFNPTSINISDDGRHTIISYLNTAVLVWRVTNTSSIPRAISNTPNFTITHPNNSNTSDFGRFVDIGTSSYVISSPKEDIDGTIGRGSVFVYNINTSTVNYSIVNPIDETNNSFGQSISIYGNKILIGSPNATDSGLSSAGVVYLFDLSNGNLLHTFTSTNPISGRKFGTVVQLTENYAYIVDGENYYTVYRLSDMKLIDNMARPLGFASPNIAAAKKHFIVGNRNWGQFNQGNALCLQWWN